MSIINIIILHTVSNLIGMNYTKLSQSTEPHSPQGYSTFMLTCQNDDSPSDRELRIRTSSFKLNI